MIFKTPSTYFFATGSSDGFTPLNAFDNALLQAGIGNTNLVKMSSIVPPRCQKIDPIPLPQGVLVPVAYASIQSDLKGEVISAAVAVAFPEEDHCGLIMEYSSRGRKEDVESIVREMAREGMKTRGLNIKHVESRSVEHRVTNIGAAIAAVVLWDKDAGEDR